MKIAIPINVDSEGCSKCIPAVYFRQGCYNFLKQNMLNRGGHKKHAATGVLEIYAYEGDEEDEFAAMSEMTYKIGNKRLEAMLAKAVENNLSEGKYVLDCYMGRTIREIFFHTITSRIRKLTPTECLALMGVRERERERLAQSGISNSQLYKMAGNSIVVDVLMGIFGQMFNPKAAEDERQLKFPWI